MLDLETLSKSENLNVTSWSTHVSYRKLNTITCRKYNCTWPGNKNVENGVHKSKLFLFRYSFVFCYDYGMVRLIQLCIPSTSQPNVSLFFEAVIIVCYGVDDI